MTGDQFFTNYRIEDFNWTQLQTYLTANKIIQQTVNNLNGITGLTYFQEESLRTLLDISLTLKDILFNHISKNIFFELLLKHDSTAPERARNMVSNTHQMFFKKHPNPYAKLEYYVNELIILTQGLMKLMNPKSYHEKSIIEDMLKDLDPLQKKFLPHYSSTPCMLDLREYLTKKANVHSSVPAESVPARRDPESKRISSQEPPRKDSGIFAQFTVMVAEAEEEKQRDNYPPDNHPLLIERGIVPPPSIWTKRR